MQSVSLPPTSQGGGSPGIAVGSTLQVPTAGQYELYLVYDLSDAQATLDLMQRTLGIGSLALVLLIAAITYLSPNSVKTYIRSAYAKIGVTSRTQAVLWGVRYGLHIEQRRLDTWRVT